MKETVVTFNNGSRKISMYFSELEDGGLDMQMSVTPELKEGEEPDMPLMLAGTLMSALNAQLNDEDDEPTIITTD